MEILKEEPYAGQSYAAVLGAHASNPKEGRLIGVPLTVLDRGWLLSTDEARIKAQFEETLMERVEARIAAVAKRDLLMAESLRSTYITDVGAGNFAWDGKVSREARSEWEGNCLLLFLLLRRCDGQESVTLDDARDMMHDDSSACMAALRQAQGNWPTSQAREARRAARARRQAEEEARRKAMQPRSQGEEMSTTATSSPNPGT